MSDAAVLTEEDFDTALHEAAHAVVGKHLGMTMSRIVIRPYDSRRNSRTFFADGRDAQSMIIMAFSGSLMEMRIEGGADRGSNDREFIAKLARENNFSQRQIDIFARMAAPAPDIKAALAMKFVDQIYFLTEPVWRDSQFNDVRETARR
jgi:hypothetical protein